MRKKAPPLEEYDKLIAKAKALLSSDDEWCDTCGDVARFGELAKRDEAACRVLVELTSHANGLVRFLSATALAGVPAERGRVVPILAATLDAYREMGYPESRQNIAILAMASLMPYGAEALAAESSVWPYFYAQPNLELAQLAAWVVSGIAEASNASDTILHILCHHEDDTLRQLCRDLATNVSKEPTPEATAEAAEQPKRYQLRVDGKELRTALKQLTLARKRRGKSEFMVLSFADGVLTFSMDKITSGASAEGTWPTDVLASAASIYGLARVPPKSDTVRVSIEGDRLRIGSSVMPVQWMPGGDAQ